MANKHKSKHTNRGPLWNGLFVRRTKTKKEKLESAEKKHKKSL